MSCRLDIGLSLLVDMKKPPGRNCVGGLVDDCGYADASVMNQMFVAVSLQFLIRKADDASDFASPTDLFSDVQSVIAVLLARGVAGSSPAGPVAVAFGDWFFFVRQAWRAAS